MPILCRAAQTDKEKEQEQKKEEEGKASDEGELPDVNNNKIDIRVAAVMSTGPPLLCASTQLLCLTPVPWGCGTESLQMKYAACNACGSKPVK